MINLNTSIEDWMEIKISDMTVAGGSQLILMETVLLLTGWKVPIIKTKIDTTTTKQPTDGYILP